MRKKNRITFGHSVRGHARTAKSALIRQFCLLDTLKRENTTKQTSKDEGDDEKRRQIFLFQTFDPPILANLPRRTL